MVLSRGSCARDQRAFLAEPLFGSFAEIIANDLDGVKRLLSTDFINAGYEPLNPVYIALEP